MSTITPTTHTYESHAICWKSVLAGVAFALATAWIMYLLGAALGFSIINPNDQNIATGLGIGTALWILLTWLVSLFLGGLIAGRVSNKVDPSKGLFQGLTVWSICIVLTVITGAIGINQLTQTGSQLLSAAPATASVVLSAGNATDKNTDLSPKTTSTLSLEADIKRQIAELASSGANADSNATQQALNQLSNAQLAKIAAYLLQDNPDAAKNTMAINSNLTKNQINQIIGNLDNSIQQSKQTIKDYTQSVTNYTAATLWMILVSQLLSLITAIIGGWMGADVLNKRYPTKFHAFQGETT